MGLTPTDNWLRAANSGSAEPVLKIEFSPTIAYDEKRGRTDWQTGENLVEIDTGHHSDELRLARSRSEVHPEQQLKQDAQFFPMQDVYIWDNGQKVHDGATLGRLVQIFRSERSFKLKYLYLSVFDNGEFTGRLSVKIVTGLSQGVPVANTAGDAVQMEQMLENTKELGKLEIDYGSREPIYTDNEPNAAWVVYDFSDLNVWIPGGDIPCAIVLEPSGNYKPDSLVFRGSKLRASYSKGCLYWGIPGLKRYWLQSGQLSFKFKIDGFAESGGGEWLLDLGQTPTADCEGELELRYCEPEGTSASFEMAEADSAYGFNTSTKFSRVSDGSRISRRFVKLRVSMKSDSLGIDTPRIKSLRAAFMSRINWLLASRPLFGYPNLVAEAPDYSAEGDPLSGSGAATDTSRIELLDAGGLVSGLFAANHMKNDRVRIWLGFDSPYFRDSGGKDPGDWLPFKTVWIEDWEPGEGVLTVHCYDQQIMFRQAQAPVTAASPSQTEHIYYDRANPIAIKYDLLRRAGIRPAEIDFTPAVGSLTALAGDSGSFARLASAHDWEMVCAVRSTTSLESLDSELNRHLLAFQLVDERGRWVVRYADFSCTLDSVSGWTCAGQSLPAVESDCVIAGSETCNPGLKYLRNYGLVYFGGEGGDENAYTALEISPGTGSAKAYKESSSDKLLSSFIPADREDQARQVALRRRLLQYHGLRSVQFTTGLRFAGIQIGDHINFYSKHYSRSGATAPNPLLVMITRKNIDRNFSSINWAGVVLLDAEQTADEEYVVHAPASLEVEAQGNGNLIWQWLASVDEAGSGVAHYDLFQRLSHLRDWGAPVHSVPATRAASYYWSGSAYQEALQYDFGVRAVHSSGVTSAISVHENVVLTGPVPDAPSASDWMLRSAPGAITVSIINPVAGVTHYCAYVLTSGKWAQAGSFLPGQEFVYHVPAPFSRKVYLLTVTAINKWGESAWAPVKIKINEPLNPGDLVPGAPAFDSAGGTYPLVSRLPVGTYHAFSIMLKLNAPSFYADYVERYEFERQSKRDIEGAGWSDWERLPDHQIKLENDQTPPPVVLYYDNTDRRLAPGHIYQFRARAVSRWGVAGEWSGTMGLLLTDDTVGPDQPQITVYSETGRVRIEIDEPAIDGGPCPDFSHFIIEGNPGGLGWQVLDSHWTGTQFHHTGLDSGLEVSWVYRVSAVDHSGNVSPVSETSGLGKQKKADYTYLAETVLGAGTPGTLSQITQNAQEIELRVQYGEVINAINVSAEGVRINASRLSVSGSTEFAGGYNPYSKLEAVGGQYSSASSGARVRIFPDSNTGIQVTDGTNDVFRCVVGGEDVGDVIIGSAAGQHVMWDRSAGELEISGMLDAGGGIKTGSGNDRIEIGKYGGTDQIKFFTAGVESGWIKNDSGELTLKMLSGSDYHYLTRHGFGIYKNGTFYARLQTGSYSDLYLEDDNGQSLHLSTVPFAGTEPVLSINGTQVLTVQQPAIGNPSGGGTVDSEARAAIGSILVVLRTHGLIDT